MKANIVYKFELMPTREQKRIFAQAAGCRRFVWNKAIELQKRCLEQEVPFLKEALQKPSLILRPESFYLLHRPNFCANDCSGYF